MKINELKTPCYVIDEGKLTENLKILHHVMQRTEEMDELVKICDHIVFNSVSQFLVHKEKIKEAAAEVSTGLRINPECSTQEGHEIYDPCGTGSRLGITRAELD